MAAAAIMAIAGIGTLGLQAYQMFKPHEVKQIQRYARETLPSVPSYLTGGGGLTSLAAMAKYHIRRRTRRMPLAVVKAARIGLASLKK